MIENKSNEQISLSECKRLAKKYLRVKEQKRVAEKAIRSFKEEFESKMEKYFEQENIEKSLDISFYDESSSYTESIRVNRVQKKTVEFDADKLEKCLEKQLSKKVILKKYEINNYKGLVKYLKSCGVNPEEFKKYITVKKQVDVEELDRLEELGRIDLDTVSGCYKVIFHNPFFTVNKIKQSKKQG